MSAIDSGEQGTTGRGISRFGASALAIAGALFLLYAAVLALQSTFSHWGLAKTVGQVVRVVSAQASAEGASRSAPVVAFTDATGKQHTVLMAQAPRAISYAAGDTVDVLYDAREPSQARVTGFTQTFVFPLLLASAGALLLLVAATMSEPPESLRLLSQRSAEATVDPALLQFHPFNAVAVKHYLAECGAPDSKRKVKIIDGVQALSQGRIPVGLAEFLSYAAALAYRDDCAQYLASHCPRATSPAQFENGGARALAFVFEGYAVIAVAETESVRPLAQVRQLFERRAGAREFVPDETVWDASPRKRTAARAWDGLRAQVEAWVKEVAPDHHLRDEDAVAVPFLLTGHATGGTMAVIAAYEFAKRGRPIAAAVTFGAAGAGGKAFGHEYRELGLDGRTLDISAKQSGLPLLSWPLSRRTPAVRWPLAPLGVAQAASSSIVAQSFAAGAVHRLLSAEEESGLNSPRGFVRGWMLRLLGSFRTARLAMLRHDIERRYALPLTVMMQQRLGEVLAGEKGSSATVAQAISDHLLDIRGVRPEDAREGFLTLEGLPAAASAASQDTSESG